MPTYTRTETVGAWDEYEKAMDAAMARYCEYYCYWEQRPCLEYEKAAVDAYNELNKKLEEAAIPIKSYPTPSSRRRDGRRQGNHETPNHPHPAVNQRVRDHGHLHDRNASGMLGNGGGMMDKANCMYCDKAEVCKYYERMKELRKNTQHKFNAGEFYEEIATRCSFWERA